MADNRITVGYKGEEFEGIPFMTFRDINAYLTFSLLVSTGTCPSTPDSGSPEQNA